MLGEDRRRSEVGTGRSGVPMLVSGMHRRRWEISELKKEKVQYNGFMLLCIESANSRVGCICVLACTTPTVDVTVSNSLAYCLEMANVLVRWIHHLEEADQGDF